MFWILILLVGVWALSKQYTKSHPRRPSASPVTRAQVSGDVGEARVLAELRCILSQLCGDDFYAHPTALLLLHAPGTEYPTAEVDHLVVTPFGIFVIETKNWAGAIVPGSTADTVVCHQPGWQARRTPLAGQPEPREGGLSAGHASRSLERPRPRRLCSRILHALPRSSARPRHPSRPRLLVAHPTGSAREVRKTQHQRDCSVGRRQSADRP
ncbi:nuclease-related domain-containing protein [Burkholderia sp. BCC0405]|uniref:nuclease-related domain-containing protein n=1 Tax=Burkholderia sp. BCC0405 TaxID=2676298 RepID=UPI001FC89D40|nr:nuclease-related domain-containing protein [Burkholderia sp. BCC0405]